MIQTYNEILIVNLLRFGDIFCSAHLINSLKQKFPDAKISILVWEEFKTAASRLKEISNVYTINRKKILTYKKNDIYSDAFALETFYKNLSIMKSQAWSQVINYSNDKISAHISNYLSDHSTQSIGMKFNEKLNITPSSSWDIVFNDILTTLESTPVHFIDCYQRMTGTPTSNNLDKIKIDTKFNEVAFKNIGELREQNKKDGHNLHIIGIQLFTSDESKNIPYKELIKTIDLLASNDSYLPILLIAPTEKEKSFAYDINNEFNNELVIVEADFKAVPSLLMNIDLLLTPDTVIKHIADLIDTPVVEVSLGKSPFLKQGTIGQYNLIVTNNIANRDYIEDKDNKIRANDIFCAIKVVTQNRNFAEFSISTGVTIYQPSRDVLGIKYRYLAGDCNTKCEVSRIMSRILLAQIYNIEDTHPMYQELQFFNPIDIKKWIEVQKVALSDTVKDVLGTLRALHMTKKNNSKTGEFITSLDKLLTHCDDQTLVSIPCILFRAKLEAINSTSFIENRKMIEALLFLIKDEIQLAYHCIKKLDELTQVKVKPSVNMTL